MSKLKKKWTYLELFVEEFPEYRNLYDSMRLADEYGDIRTASTLAGQLREAMRAKGRLD
ncbi:MULTISPECIES: hypothetical protein [unclassified Paenibacillus]|uniref:hypothetical protein n=1 Tax=unclassified Paenibacillus TaxID=185978 RepID=UPI002406E22D|nr:MULTISPECIES: hypothetical protein [unclassified Paenibacillus]MDF9845124.1 hypothetical protein [Paenibacillus sp. PastF-2]MDF9851723.1 hypothetical protein [Paenibacillus sp. PastM-2]MDF9858324.1 hypothetical protein [Paenibacillus sp. PastF-1]MDH6483596.1 hypothetical protein [Paenibacillus sp. PastH-2]MDH6510999.1 hypothetical protein [Paenibacillus sp. PastM-3]